MVLLLEDESGEERFHDFDDWFVELPGEDFWIQIDQQKLLLTNNRRWDNLYLMNETYEQREVVKMLGVKPQTLRYWSTRKAISPAIDSIGRPGIRRRYDFNNLIEITVLRELYKQGIPSVVAEEAIDHVKRSGYGEKICYLQIIGRSIKVISDQHIQGLTDEYDKISKSVNAMLKWHKITAKGKYEEGAIKKMLQVKEKYTIDSGDMDVLIGIAIDSFIMRSLLDSEETMVIVPVHSLREEVVAAVEKSI